jgi:hypothetical protein
MIIPSVPEKAWKRSSAIFANVLLAFGLVGFAVMRGPPAWFWFVWFGFICTIALATLIEYRWEIRQAHGDIVRSSLFLGRFPLSSKRYQIADISHIERRVKRASGYDSGSEGIYRPSIALVLRDGTAVPLQQFLDRPSKEHPVSAAWAQGIAAASGLEVRDVIETWEGFI